MKKLYNTRGTCSRQILVDVNDSDKTINNVEFYGGCNGNLKGISRLVEGKPAAEVQQLLAGTTCGLKGTSCPDQLATAIGQALAYKG